MNPPQIDGDPSSSLLISEIWVPLCNRPGDVCDVSIYNVMYVLGHLDD